MLLKTFEEAQEYFKVLGIELDKVTYDKMKREEENARQIQLQAKDIGGSAYVCEESNAKCIECSSGMSYLEHSLYGNRCVFCAGKKRNILLPIFIVRAMVDYLIYSQSLRLARKYKNDGRLKLLGALGYIGMNDINQAKTIFKKIQLFFGLLSMR